MLSPTSPAPASVRPAAQQLLLPDLLPAWQPIDALFFALLPDATATDAVARRADELRRRHRLRGRPLAPARFHVSLHGLGTHYGLPRDLVARALAAAATVARSPFAVEFDRALSFVRNAEGRPFVLRGDGHASALTAFHRQLGAALTRAGLDRHLAAAFTPHVTLLYDRQLVAEHPMEPLGWTVRDFALVHSRVGLTQHVVLGRWPLGGER